LVDSQGKPLMVNPPPAPTARPPSAPEPPASYDFERPTRAPSVADNLGVDAPDAPTTEPPADSGPARDLSAELSAALAPVTRCVDLAQAAGQPDGRLVVSVSAYVLASGRISRATIDALGQPVAALSCLEREVLTIKLRDPVAGAPINVRGSTEVQVRAVAPHAPAAPLPPPMAPNPPADVAQGQADDIARPDQADQAGPP
jgi:hypothetical protein